MEVKLDKIEINWDKSLSLKIQTYALNLEFCTMTDVTVNKEKKKSFWALKKFKMKKL